MSIDTTSTKHRCQDEDDRGRRCVYGVGHEEKCRFTPYHPSPAQWAVLEDAGRVNGVRNRVYVSTSEVASFKALSRRGFLRIRYIASRTWDIALTKAGRDLLFDRPR